MTTILSNYIKPLKNFTIVLGIAFFLSETSYVRADSIRVNPNNLSLTDSGQGQKYYPSEKFYPNLGAFDRSRISTLRDGSVDVFVSKSFNEEQKHIIYRALTIMMINMLNPDVLDCTYKNAYRNYALYKMLGTRSPYESDREYLEDSVRNTFILDRYDIGTSDDDKAGELYIDAANLGKPNNGIVTAANATQGYFTAGNNVPTVNAPDIYDREFRLANSNLFLSAYELWHEKHRYKFHARINLNIDIIGDDLMMNTSTANSLGGTIAHEILHNLGWEHTNNNLDNYPGTVIKEYGLCVAKTPIQTFGLINLLTKNNISRMPIDINILE
jgi:hypothetical protein